MEEDPRFPDGSSVSSLAFLGVKRVQNHYRYGATSCRGFPSSQRSNADGLRQRQDRLMRRKADAAFCQNSRCQRTPKEDRTKWPGKPLFPLHPVPVAELTAEVNGNNIEKP